ncbi:hypothetical protein HHL19_22295 [Streptomyces sp. R302]|uniref:hypothetical protein n=1 Tax=unclassified Streptomyces TaxID=2593676 RepID=UPI00145EB31A|nr:MULTISPECIES: hypothetical protein [unclassified Streptomyces]NML51696.1 hypothetical protein [Streptomyces sp. R301]NML81316.1 hypothetical protein [Streptomyces sp. R302]
MTSYPRVTVLALDETVLRESPIFAALACQWLESGRFVPGAAAQDRPLALVSVTPTRIVPVLPELVPVSRGARGVVSGVERR